MVFTPYMYMYRGYYTVARRYDRVCDKDGVHLPQTSGFGLWRSGLSILLVLLTSEWAILQLCA